MTNPASIISLVPSLTELLFDLGLGDRISGRTRFCIHPEKKVENIQIVGGTKNPDLEKVQTINPDLVIANLEENRKEDVTALREFTDVMLTDISTIEEARLAIHEIGERCGAQKKATSINKKINDQLQNIPDEPSQRVAYFIWKDPWMTVGHDTYIHSVLTHWNLQNVFGSHNRYPKVTLNDVCSRNPELILLSSEPYPFKEKHKAEVQEHCPNTRILQVNGEWFSWYGSRMIESFKQLNHFRKAIS
ncbi:MAG: helical backbone metal receptor [Balneolaceae bacterium]